MHIEKSNVIIKYGKKNRIIELTLDVSLLEWQKCQPLF